MTDPRNPSDPGNPREGESSPDQWTWQRPADGSPVYGEPASGQQPPAYPSADQPPAEDPSWQGYPPGVGPAQPGGPVHQAPPPQGYPPQQWPAHHAQDQYGGQQPPPPMQYGGYAPNYAQPVPPTSGVNKGMFSFFTGIFSLIMGICCCPPIGIIGGIVGAVLGWSGMKEDKESGKSGTLSALGFWFSIAAIILAVANLIFSLIIQIFYPELYSQMLRDLGLG